MCPSKKKCFSLTTQCQCREGFTTNVIGDCEDIDECADKSHSCRDNSCVNKEGTFECYNSSTNSPIDGNTITTTSTSSTTTTAAVTTFTTTITTTSFDQTNRTILVLSTAYDSVEDLRFLEIVTLQLYAGIRPLWLNIFRCWNWIRWKVNLQWGAGLRPPSRFRPKKGLTPGLFKGNWYKVEYTSRMLVTAKIATNKKKFRSENFSRSKRVLFRVQ